MLHFNRVGFRGGNMVLSVTVSAVEHKFIVSAKQNDTDVTFAGGSAVTDALLAKYPNFLSAVEE